MGTCVQTLPRTPVACDSELIVTVESVPRSAVPTILARLTNQPHHLTNPSSSSIGPSIPQKAQFYNSANSTLTCAASMAMSRPAANSIHPTTQHALPIVDKRIGFSRPRYKSVSQETATSMDDSGCFDVDSLPDTFSPDEVFSPPSKIVRSNSPVAISRRATAQSIPTLRNLLTSPVSFYTV